MIRISDGSISGIITSPPYNITSKRKDVYYNNGYSNIDGLSEDEYLRVRVDEFVQFSRILENTGVICYNISYHNENPILPTLLISKIHKETDLTVADIITWKKSTSIPFQTSPTKLSRICELVYVIVKKEFLHEFKTNDSIKCKLKASFSEDFVTKLLDIYFHEGSLIYDPFMGIGTTARACKKSSRNYIGSELDKEHFDISISLL